MAIAIVGLLWQEVAAIQQDRATTAANDRDWTAADAPARSAAALDPDIGSYQLTAGLTASRAGDHQAAAQYFARVAERDDLPEAWLNLAAEQFELDLPAQALESVRRSLRVGWQRPVISLPAGDLALKLGDPELATEAFGAAMSRIPSLAADPWWAQSDERTSVLPAALEEAVRLASPDHRWEIMLMAGDTARARALAVAADPTGYGSKVVDAWAGADSTATQLLDECRANPLDQVRILWCARLASHRGETAVANAFLDLANISWQSSYVGGAETRVSETGMTGRQLIGDPADLWATYTYRRPAPWDILVPTLLHLTIE